MASVRKKLFTAIFFAAFILALSTYISVGNAGKTGPAFGIAEDTALFAAGDAESIKESVVLPDTETQPKEKERDISAEKLAAMLDMNYCYNQSFDSTEALRGCAAMSLSDYASDFDGYGLCVSSAFVEVFADDFYGIELSPLSFDGSAPEGYIAVPECGSGTFCHIPVTLTATEDGFELITRMEYYGGGSDRETHLVKSRFNLDRESAFGVNLVFSEIL